MRAHPKAVFVENPGEAGMTLAAIASAAAGGTADIVISDPENMLESGIEINVQPPGKMVKSISLLSGGEQSRLRLCMLMDEKINLLILDEPTNHLDIASREWVEAAIEEFEGVLLFVSHDRYFIEKFAERIWLLEDGTIRDFPCGYRKYRSILEHEAAAKQPVAAAPKPKKEKPKGGEKEAAKQLRRLEREIEKQEQVIAQLDEAIEAAAADYQELTRLLGEKEAAEETLMELMEAWDTLA